MDNPEFTLDFLTFTRIYHDLPVTVPLARLAANGPILWLEAYSATYCSVVFPPSTGFARRREENANH